jgi:hypothetical protein
MHGSYNLNKFKPLLVVPAKAGTHGPVWRHAEEEFPARQAAEPEGLETPVGPSSARACLRDGTPSCRLSRRENGSPPSRGRRVTYCNSIRNEIRAYLGIKRESVRIAMPAFWLRGRKEYACSATAVTFRLGRLIPPAFALDRFALTVFLGRPSWLAPIMPPRQNGRLRGPLVLHMLAVGVPRPWRKTTASRPPAFGIAAKRKKELSIVLETAR